MNKYTFVFTLLSAFVLVSCEQSDTKDLSKGSAIDKANDQQSYAEKHQMLPPEKAAEKLNAIYLDYDAEFIELNPILAVFRSNMKYNDQFGDPGTDQYLAESKALDEKYLAQIKRIDPNVLTDKDRVSYDIFKYNREQNLEAYANGTVDFNNMMPVNQIFSLPQFFPMLGSGQTAQPFATVTDYENWIKRAKGFNSYVDLAIKRMQQGVNKGVVMPTLLMAKTLPQLESQVMPELEKSPFYMPITNMPDSFTDEEKSRLKAAYKDLIENNIMKGYAKLANYIKNDYMKHTRETHGIGSLPGGKVAYEQAIRNMTTTNMTADVIHQVGLAEAKKLYAGMQKIKEQVSFKGDMQAFFEHLKTDPKFYFNSPDELMQGYEDLRKLINPKLDMIFNIQPKTDYVLKQVEPYRERSMAAAQYFPGSPDRSRPGIFYVNTYDLKSRPKWMMETLSIHEASPGHHFQVSINLEAGNLPPFRRFGGYRAYSEGWGLYSETLGKEMGLYSDPYQYFGMLYAQIWRANRLVVDTGMHAKGWTREQAIAFMKSNSPVSETDVVAEVERYMAAPGQALSYMIGNMKIRELRKRAEKALGEKFDVRDFHYEVLADGAMPLAILEQKIDRWIARLKNN